MTLQKRNVLLTGATGFLGNEVLTQLIADPRVESITVVARGTRKHTSPKVRTLQVDLSMAESVQRILSEPLDDLDVVIHLAGLYDFSESTAPNYLGNVLPTLNILKITRKLNEKKPVT